MIIGFADGKAFYSFGRLKKLLKQANLTSLIAVKQFIEGWDGDEKRIRKDLNWYRNYGSTTIDEFIMVFRNFILESKIKFLQKETESKWQQFSMDNKCCTSIPTDLF